LPHLQQLQLKHCSLVGVTLDDIITKPLVSHTQQSRPTLYTLL
jgi:hypothetical protein